MNYSNTLSTTELHNEMDISTISTVSEGDTERDIIREQASEYFLYQLAINVHKYWLITMAGLGIVGNIISLIVMRQVSEFSLIDM